MQEKYRRILHAQERFIILYGGRDSGKSYAAAQLVLKTLMMEEYARVVLVRKRHVDIKDSQFQTLVDIITSEGLNSMFHITTSPLKIVCLTSGNFLIARGLDKASKLKSIANPTMIWYEEADEISLMEFIKSSQSLRASSGSHLQEILTFNPENEEENFLAGFFFPPKSTYENPTGVFGNVKSKRADTVIIHSTYKDNLYCTPERQALLESLKDYAPDLYGIYVLGLWGGALKGLIYEKYSVEKFMPDSPRWTCYGLDFGYTNDPSALVKVSMSQGKLYFQEIFYLHGLTNTDISALLKEKGISKHDQIVCDSAEPKSIEELRRMGWRVRGAEKGADSIRNGIGVVNRFPIVYTADSLHLLSERKKYKWKENMEIPEDMPGHYLQKPIDLFNHGHDALRYAVSYMVKAGGGLGASARMPTKEDVLDEYVQQFL